MKKISLKSVLMVGLVFILCGVALVYADSAYTQYKQKKAWNEFVKGDPAKDAAFFESISKNIGKPVKSKSAE